MSRRSGTSDGRITPEPIDPEVLAVIRDQPPAPTGESEREILAQWIGSDQDAEDCLSELAEAGHVIFTPDEVATITRALHAEARGIGSYPVACLEILQRLAARQPEGVRE